MATHCRRCGGSVVTQRFCEVDGSGVRATCLLCGEMVEQLEAEPLPTLAEMKRIARAKEDRREMAG